VVTTVLIILVVLAGIVIIWTFISRFLDKAGEQIETDSLTVSMSILPESLFVDNVITNDPRPAGMIVRRNAGVGNPAGFVLSFEDETKKIVMYTIEFSELNPPRVMNEFDTMPVSISNFGNRGLLKVVKVGVAPFFRRGASVIIGTYFYLSVTDAVLPLPVPDFRDGAVEPTSSGSPQSGGGGGSNNGGGQTGGTSVCGTSSQFCAAGSSQVCTVAGYAGTQSCNADCSAWNTCTPLESCGDSIVQLSAGEQCEGSASVACESIDPSLYYGGSASCNPTTCTYGVSSCSSYQFISSCTTISAASINELSNPDKKFRLSSNVFSSGLPNGGACIGITTSDVEFDGRNRAIVNRQSGGTNLKGISVDGVGTLDGVIVKNVQINSFSGGDGVYVQGTNNIQLISVSVTGATRGLALYQSSGYVVDGCSLNGISSYPIELVFATRGTVTNNYACQGSNTYDVNCHNGIVNNVDERSCATGAGNRFAKAVIACTANGNGLTACSGFPSWPVSGTHYTSCTTGPSGSVCGDGLTTGSEECDGADMGGRSPDCTEHNPNLYAGGDVSCDNCGFDYSQCVLKPVSP